MCNNAPDNSNEPQNQPNLSAIPCNSVPSVDPNYEAPPKISENPRQSAAKTGRGWGGKRPGAGAPKGNLNALKHGRRSKQFAEIGALIAQSDTARNALLAAAHRRHSAEAKAEETAAAIVIDLFLHARGIAQGKDSPGPFRHLLDAGGMGACPERPDRSRGSRRVAAGKATPGPFQHRARLNDPAKASSAPQSSRSPAQLNADLIEIARLTATNPPDNQPSKPQSSDPLDPDTNQPPNPHD